MARDCVKTDAKGTHYILNGREVTQAEYEEWYPPRTFEDRRAAAESITQWKRPVISDALAVHPRQIKQVLERNKRHGVNVEYLPDGRPAPGR